MLGTDENAVLAKGFHLLNEMWCCLGYSEAYEYVEYSNWKEGNILKNGVDEMHNNYRVFVKSSDCEIWNFLFGRENFTFFYFKEITLG